MASLHDEQIDHAHLTEYAKLYRSHEGLILVIVTTDEWQQDMTLYLFCGIAFFMVDLRSTLE